MAGFYSVSALKAFLMPIFDSQLRYLLSPFGYLYDAGVGVRNLLYDLGWVKAFRISKPVISIGNLSFGGTGKTPLVAQLARYLRDSGLRVCIISRGYGRKSRGRVLVSDFTQVYADAASAGDEPAMLARNCHGVMVVVDSDRVAAARAFESDCDCFILDDGFQHRRLYRNLDIVLLDSRRPLPGPGPSSLSGYREGKSGLKRASLIVLTHASSDSKSDFAGKLEPLLRPGTRVFSSTHRIGSFRDLITGAESTPDRLRDLPVVAFSGIGNPSAFESALKQLGAQLKSARRFGDHHWYRSDELLAMVKEYPGDTLVTTEKDEIKLLAFLADFPHISLLAARLEVDVDDWNVLAAEVMSRTGLERR